MRTIGASRLVFGTGWPLRLTQTPRANLTLLPDDIRGQSLGDANAIVRAARSHAKNVVTT
jgi:hypothetical protein